MNVEAVIEEIRKAKDIEDVLAKYDWKSFEEFVEFVFQQHDFDTKRNFRFKTEKRYEIDVLAEREVIVCVDCKKWGKGRYKRSSLLKAAERQKERVDAFKKFSGTKKQVFPIIVTLMDEVLEDDMLVLPVWKLNEFLLELG